MSITQKEADGAKAPEDLKSFRFVRHGATDLNEETKFVNQVKYWRVQGGGTDEPLNKNGEQQARAAGNVLRKLDIGKVVSSPQQRALQTFAFASFKFQGFVTDDNLKERHYGKHEGGWGARTLFEENHKDVENLEDLDLRAAKALIHAREEGTLFIAHGGMLDAFCRLLGVKLLPEQRDNACVLDFAPEGSEWTATSDAAPVILISGATGGIGMATAKEFIAHGYTVSLGARNVKALVKAFGPENKRVQYEHFDAEKFDTIEAWVKAAAEKSGGRISGVVNNAGYSARGDIKEPIDYDALDKEFTINVTATMRLTELCLPYLKSAGSGRVINMNSMSGVRVLNSFAGYNITKHALTGFTKTIQHACWDDGVRAIDICPGFVNTPMSEWTDLIEKKDMIQPEDIAQLVREAVERPNNAFVPKYEVICMKEATR